MTHEVVLIFEMNSGLFPQKDILGPHSRTQEHHNVEGNDDGSEGYSKVEKTGKGTNTVLIRNMDIFAMEGY